MTTESKLDVACARLKAAGMRITQPRIAILTTLINQSQPRSIEQIHKELDNDACDLVTVYRCLAVFEELGLVRRCFFHNGAGLYEFCQNSETQYHVVMRNTNVIRPLDGDLADELRRLMAKVQSRLENHGYTQISHMVEFFANDVPALPSTQTTSLGIPEVSV